MTDHPTGTLGDHLRARIRLLEAAKEHTRRGGELAAQRQARPRCPAWAVMSAGMAAMLIVLL